MQTTLTRGGGSEFFTFFPNVNIMQTIRLIDYQGNFPNFNFFPNQVRGGGVIKYHFFPKFKILHIILGGGVKKIMDFFHNLGHFLFGMLPLKNSRVKKSLGQVRFWSKKIVFIGLQMCKDQRPNGYCWRSWNLILILFTCQYIYGQRANEYINKSLRSILPVIA